MKIAIIRLLQEPDKSFILLKETNPFSPCHHHPEYEPVPITKGRSKKMAGDQISRFEENVKLYIAAAERVFTEIVTEFRNVSINNLLKVKVVRRFCKTNKLISSQIGEIMDILF